MRAKYYGACSVIHRPLLYHALHYATGRRASLESPFPSSAVASWILTVPDIDPTFLGTDFDFLKNEETTDLEGWECNGIAGHGPVSIASPHNASHGALDAYPPSTALSPSWLPNPALMSGQKWNSCLLGCTRGRSRISSKIRIVSGQ